MINNHFLPLNFIISVIFVVEFYDFCDFLCDFFMFSANLCDFFTKLT